MNSIIQQITEWLKGILVSGIMDNLTNTFSSVNDQVGQIATEVGKTPSNFMPAVFNMVRNLSESVIMPVAGILLTFIACYELIQLIISYNNLASFETWFIWKWIFKTFVAVELITHTFDITMAVFDVSQSVVRQAGGIIQGSTAVDASTLATMQSTLEAMELGPLFAIFLQSFIVQFLMYVLSAVIFVIINGRMVEIYLMVSLAPLPFATFGNREQSMMGQNYMRSLFALGFQGFLIMVCVGIYGQTLNVGRVMTPTLAMIVQREAEIDGFKPEPIYRLSISCGGITALSDRFEKKQDAENILNVLKEQKAAQVTKIDPADKQEKAPQLYSLTALQRDANRFLGFTAQQTLDYTQSLYEKKLVTYPRTDSRFLTEDMESMIHDLAGKMAAKFGYTRKMVVHPKQVIKNSKVSDHHAIIPTVNVADAEFGKLPSGEQKVLSLITARLLSALGDPAVRNEVDVEFTCADTVFRAKAKNIREKGWRDIQEWIMGGSAESTDSENNRKEKSENADMLACIATLTNGKSYPLQNPKMEEGKTTPKKHFTDVIFCERKEWIGIEERSSA